MEEVAADAVEGQTKLTLLARCDVTMEHKYLADGVLSTCSKYLAAAYVF